jgi:hypothetical protein
MRPTKQRRTLSIAAAFVLATGVWVDRAGASPLFEWVGDATGDGGIAARHAGAGAASTYFNPALLPRAEERLEAGFLLLVDDIDVDPARRTDADMRVSREAAGAFHGGGALEPVYPPPIPTAWLEEGCASDCEQALVDDPAAARPRQGAEGGGDALAYFALGLVDRLIDDKLVFGLYLLVPVSELTRATSFYNDEREQYFSNTLYPELYSDRLEATSIAFGFGSRPLRWLSLGVSVTFAFDNRAEAPTFVPDASRYEELLIRNDVRAEQSLAPHMGVAVEPVDDLVFTATLHTRQALVIEAGFSAFLPDGSEQRATRRFSHHDQPWSLALGGEYRMRFRPWHALGLVAGATFTRWSEYRDRHDEAPSGAYAWSDTVSPTVGLRHTRGRTDALLDASWVTSPVPEQSGRTNYVDTDRLALAGGLQYRFAPWGVPLRAGVHARLDRLLPRTDEKRIPPGGYDGDDLVRDEVPDDAVRKSETDVAVEPRDGLQTNNPGFPGFSIEGWLLAAGVNLALLF